KYIGGVFAAELQPDRHERSRRGALDGLAARDRPGEVHVVDLARAQQSLRLLVTEHDVLEQSLWQTSRVGRGLKAFTDEKRLRRVLQEHGVPRHQRRKDGIA